MRFFVHIFIFYLSFLGFSLELSHSSFLALSSFEKNKIKEVIIDGEVFFEKSDGSFKNLRDEWNQNTEIKPIKDKNNPRTFLPSEKTLSFSLYKKIEISPAKGSTQRVFIPDENLTTEAAKTPSDLNYFDKHKNFDFKRVFINIRFDQNPQSPPLISNQH